MEEIKKDGYDTEMAFDKGYVENVANESIQKIRKVARLLSRCIDDDYEEEFDGKTAKEVFDNIHCIEGMIMDIMAEITGDEFWGYND